MSNANLSSSDCSAGEQFKGVLQTKFGIPHGNCFSACVASLLGLGIEDVPEYQCDYSDSQWWDKWLAWFKARGIKPELWWEPPAGLAIMDLKNPCHSVVVRDGVMIWNPHKNEPLPEDYVVDYYIELRRIYPPNWRQKLKKCDELKKAITFLRAKKQNSSGQQP